MPKTTKEIIRPSAVAGAFYPADKNELQKMLNDFLAEATTTAATDIPKIIIVPHAGYVYSGPVAAYGFKQLKDSGVKRAIILSPSHHFPVSGLILSSATTWQTPLGKVKVADLNSKLAQNENFKVADNIHKPEHAIEVEIPFLQKLIPGAEIVPIIVGQLSATQQKDFAEILSQYLDKETILVVSVDLSHYHPYQEAMALDQRSIKHILDLDAESILETEIDAPWAVASMIELAKQQGLIPKLLKYANSGDITGDKSAVVGYAAIGFYGEPQKVSINQDEYTVAEKQELLKIARTTLEKYLKQGEVYAPLTDNPKFKEKRGVFVTLKKNGQLRGCLGYIEPIKLLIEAVVDNAISAAVNDNRFLPVEVSELKDIKIEISILTVPQADALENIIKSKKGVVLQQGSLGATYLPQVWEEVPKPDQFFSSLCLKAGLDPDYWQDSKTQLLSYQAIVFGEK